MEQSNQTVLTYFIIKGISDLTDLQVPIFTLVLFIYLITLGGNMAIVVLVCLDLRLQTPMYFFLCNLSVMDMSSTTVTLHNVLFIFISGDNRISFFACVAQMYIFIALTCDELFILTAMSYDRYVAICNPLRYSVIMNRRVCALLAITSWLFSFLEVIPNLLVVSGFTCYRSNVINHFFCDFAPLMKLTCSDTFVLEIYILTEGLILGFLMPFFLTLISYIFIISTILKISTSTGRRKSFYTCSSHLVVVILLYVTLCCQYLRPTSTDNVNANKLSSLLNTVAVPLLNPLIYSLKNKDVELALRRSLKYCTSRV
ncbi:olfactory receptor 6C1-like [Discoglossus pictus]